MAAEHGAVKSELSTDSRTGALGLYEKVGMKVTSTWVSRAIDVQPAIMTATIDLPDGFTSRSLTLDDAEAVSTSSRPRRWSTSARPR